MRLSHSVAALVSVVSFSAFANTTAMTLDTQKSVLEWDASKVTGAHNGTMKLKSGNLEIKDGTITAGRFEIDMSSITVLDIKSEKDNANLVNHLKSDDFFSVQKHPTALFQVKRVDVATTPEQKKDGVTHLISGDLTIKDITRPVTIPAAVQVQGDTAKATGTVKLDRTQWDVKYRSGKFFPTIGDKMIHDDFTVKLNLEAKK